jgi:hypothetical protein
MAMDLGQSILEGIKGVMPLVDDFIYTDEERAGVEAQLEAARAQAQLAKAQREAAALQAKAAQYQAMGQSSEAQGKMIAAAVIGVALLGAVLLWKRK